MPSLGMKACLQQFCCRFPRFGKLIFHLRAPPCFVCNGTFEALNPRNVDKSSESVHNEVPRGRFS